MEVATKSADETYGYLTVPTDYVCFNPATLAIMRKGASANYLGTFASNSGGTNWYDTLKVLDIDWDTYAFWDYAVGEQTSNKLQLEFATSQLISGCSIRLLIATGGVIYTIKIYVNGTLKKTCNVNYGTGDSYITFSVDFEEAINATNISFDIYKNGGAGTIRIYSFYGWSEYFDESASWTNINDRQLSIPIASYHADDTYYLSYDLADYLKDLTAIATWSDTDGNGGQVSRAASFNYADDVDTLLMYGQLYLPTVSYPPTTYQLGAALLNEVHANFAFEEVDIGDIVSVIHDDLNITVSTRILKITQPSLDIAPAEATMEISSQIKTLADAFRTIWNRM
jgi:hypothetical protein